MSGTRSRWLRPNVRRRVHSTSGLSQLCRQLVQHQEQEQEQPRPSLPLSRHQWMRRRATPPTPAWAANPRTTGTGRLAYRQLVGLHRFATGKARPAGGCRELLGRLHRRLARLPACAPSSVCAPSRHVVPLRSATCKFDNLCLDAATGQFEYYLDPALVGGELCLNRYLPTGSLSQHACGHLATAILGPVHAAWHIVRGRAAVQSSHLPTAYARPCPAQHAALVLPACL